MIETINIFDNEEEFDKLYSMVVETIEEYTESRKGNVTMGEIMFVLESILSELREKMEQETSSVDIEWIHGNITFTRTLTIMGKILKILEQKGIISEEEYVNITEYDLE
jgi:hypothetical protein